MVRSSQLISTFGIGFHFWQEPHISHEIFKQRRGVVLPPDQSERQRQFQICHWQQCHALGTSPTGGTVASSYRPLRDCNHRDRKRSQHNNGDRKTLSRFSYSLFKWRYSVNYSLSKKR